MRRDWQAFPWSIAGEERMDYRRPVKGPHGSVLWLAAEEWQTTAGKWAARAGLVCGRMYTPLWQDGRAVSGYPTPEAAADAAEVWLSEWRAGWAAANDAALLAEIPEGGPLVVREGGGDAP